MSSDNFEQFRSLVLASESLQDELKLITDTDVFVGRVVELGAENGFQFSWTAVVDALDDNRRACLELR